MNNKLIGTVLFGYCAGTKTQNSHNTTAQITPKCPNILINRRLLFSIFILYLIYIYSFFTLYFVIQYIQGRC